MFFFKLLKKWLENVETVSLYIDMNKNSITFEISKAVLTLFQLCLIPNGKEVLQVEADAESVDLIFDWRENLDCKIKIMINIPLIEKLL